MLDKRRHLYRMDALGGRLIPHLAVFSSMQLSTQWSRKSGNSARAQLATGEALTFCWSVGNRSHLPTMVDGQIRTRATSSLL